MKKYQPVDLSKVKTYPIAERVNKVTVADFAKPVKDPHSMDELLEGLPAVLSAKDFKELINRILFALEEDKPVIWAMGAHVLKCGLGPLVIQLIEEGIIQAVAINGAGSIHDFEIALIGATSEEVPNVLHAGRFGMAEETGSLIHQALREGVAAGLGYGESLGRWILDHDYKYSSFSVLATCVRHEIPITVHVAIGTDIINQHPSMDGGIVGEASFRDFKLLTGVVCRMAGGGVWLNMGSAVILPEVFLKAVSIVENLGCSLKGIVTADFDMIKHYRPLENVVKRPTSAGGKGFSFTGQHEILIPLLVRSLLIEKARRDGTSAGGSGESRSAQQ